MRESSVEERLRKGVVARGWRCVKLSPTGVVGIPDRMVLARGGIVDLIELKKPSGGVLSRKQKLWGRWLVANGHAYWVLWTPGDVDGYLASLDDRTR